MKNKIDKRSKEYKDSLKASKPSEGLGDTIEKITEATGIKTIVKALFGEDCGCEERKAKLNAMFKYRRRVECLEESEFNYLSNLYPRLQSVLGNTDQKELLLIYNRIFNEKRQPTQCSTCWQDILKSIRKVYDEYIKEKGDN